MSPVWYIVGRIWTVSLIFLSQINCIRGDCGPPPAIPHTLPVTETSRNPGGTATYVCDRNSGYYDLPGKEKTITCKDDDTWSSVPEFCARACGVPERLAFAVPKDDDLAKDIFLPGTKVSYNCRPGYIRVHGSDISVTCLDDLSWSTPSEFCKRRECGHPGDIENGEFEVSEMFRFGSKVTYTCHEGYRFESKRNYRDCQANGQWSNELPKCSAVLCHAPDKPTDGTYSPEKDEYTYMDAVTFKCNKGLHVIGTASVACTSDGTWSNGTPTCKAVSCPDPGQVVNGRKVSGFGTSYTLYNAVRYECDNNFVMNGSSSTICTADGQWSHEIPKCLTVCAAPPEYPFAVLEEHFSNLIHFDQTAVRYECKPGYIGDPNKVNQITCSGRSWSTLAIFCSPISCGDPGNVNNAYRIESEFTFGSKVHYKCQEGYQRTSSTSYRECQVDGHWSTDAINCAVKCPSLNVDNSRLISGMKSVYVHNDTVKFECMENFVLFGSHVTTCNSRGHWEPSPPKCNGTCRITEIANTNQVVDTFKVYMEGHILVIECKEGHELNHLGTITCGSQGQWKPFLPICEVLKKGPSTGTIVGTVIGILVVIIIIILVCCCCVLKKSGAYYCDRKNDKFKQNEQELIESINAERKPKSETPDVHYTACNDA